MAQDQLKRAYALYKNGETNQASMIVRGVLREDPQNANAWWLMSHLVDDQDKVIKSLERVLKINPNHTKAREKLTRLKNQPPEDTTSFGDLLTSSSAQTVEPVRLSTPATPQVEGQDPNYWAKLDAAEAKRKNSNGDLAKAGMFGALGFLGSRFGLRIVFFIIFLGGSGIFAAFNSFQSNANLLDDNGNTPQDAVIAFYRADYMQDVDAVFDMSCDDYHDDVRDIIAFYPEYYPATTVDFSDTRFELENHDWRNNRALVTVHGVTHLEGEFGDFSYDWDEDARDAGLDFFGEFVWMIDGEWKVCEAYYISDIEWEE
ncbi:MAG: hypothetical protein AAFR67_00820 [Chloroflexota bacterium]